MKFYCSRQMPWHVYEVWISDGDGGRQSWRPVVFRGMGTCPLPRAAADAAYLDWAGRYDDSPPQAEQYVIDWDEEPDNDGWYSAEVKGDQGEVLALVSVRPLQFKERKAHENGNPQKERIKADSTDA